MEDDLEILHLRAEAKSDQVLAKFGFGSKLYKISYKTLDGFEGSIILKANSIEHANALAAANMFVQVELTIKELDFAALIDELDIDEFGVCQGLKGYI